MRQELIITIGLQGSGKSTWAENYVKNNNMYRRVERDAIRHMLFGEYYTGKSQDEKLVTAVQISTIEILAKQGYSVIVSDTNISNKTRNKFKALADKLGFDYTENNQFLKVSVDECIRRDAMRDKSVGEAVIKATAEKLKLK